MYRFDGLNQESWQPVAAANQQQETHVLSAMNSVAEDVVRNGGNCDEAALVASFFHRAVVSGDALYRDCLTLANQVDAGVVQQAAQKINRLSYALGEPFVFGDSPAPVGIITRAPADETVDDDSELFRFKVERFSNYTFGGSVALHAYILGHDGHRNGKPLKTFLPLMELKRPTGFLGETKVSDHTDRLTVGMPDIREALELNQSYVTESAWHSVEESVAALRELAGDRIVTPRSYAAD